MVEYIAKKLAIELMHQSSYLSDGDLLEVNGNLAKARIEAEPAADVVPVVHSQWVLGGYDDMYYVCKKCGHKQSEYYHKPTANFCPHCGAKMEEYNG